MTPGLGTARPGRKFFLLKRLLLEPIPPLLTTLSTAKRWYLEEGARLPSYWAILGSGTAPTGRNPRKPGQPRASCTRWLTIPSMARLCCSAGPSRPVEILLTTRGCGTVPPGLWRILNPVPRLASATPWRMTLRTIKWSYSAETTAHPIWATPGSGTVRTGPRPRQQIARQRDHFSRWSTIRRTIKLFFSAAEPPTR
jgi:hypothetical protein